MLSTTYIENVVNNRVNSKTTDIYKVFYSMLYDPHSDITRMMSEFAYISISKFIFPENRIYGFLSSGMVNQLENKAW